MGAAMEPDTRGIKFGPFWLTPSISRLNAVTYFSSAFMFVTLVTFLNFLQPYILDEILHVPAERQGAVTGGLNFFHEGTALVLMGLMGSLSDRTGRRSLIVIGLVVWAVGLALFPMAESLFELYVYRFIVAVGVATASVMVIATMQDYPQEVSRGKWGGMNSFITSFAILFLSLVVVRLPNVLTDAGFDPVQAGRITFWIGAGMALLAAVICRIGYYGGKIATTAASSSPFAGVMEGLREGRRNPRLTLAYGSAFAARGDLVVIGAFFSLWFVRAGAEQGIESSDALIKAGITMSALLLANWIWAPAFGYILDRINRVAGLCIAMTLAAIGYFAIGSVSDPYNMMVMMPATFVLGIGEISAVIAGNALIGEQAPARMRGAAVGVFGLVGTLGILCATYIGGQLFDLYGYASPFTMMAVVNAIVAVWALIVWLRIAESPAASGTERQP
jgi:MFS family permease